MNQDIYSEIKRRILFFDYLPGDMLNEKQLASEFGVSRTPVREVFLRLEWEKLISIMPRAGMIVTKLEFQQLRDVFQIRIPLEGIIGKLAATRVTESDLVAMESLKTECEMIHGSKNFSGLVNIDLRFREILTKAANNQSLKEVADSLYDQTQRVWFFVFNETNFPKVIQAEIDEIDEAIQIFSEGDPVKAEEFRQRMIIDAMARIRDIFL